MIFMIIQTNNINAMINDIFQPKYDCKFVINDFILVNRFEDNILSELQSNIKMEIKHMNHYLHLFNDHIKKKKIDKNLMEYYILYRNDMYYYLSDWYISQ